MPPRGPSYIHLEMRRFLVVLGALVLAGVPIAYLILKAPPIEVKPLPRKNPTSYVFHASADDVFVAVPMGFHRQDSFRFAPTATFTAETSSGTHLKSATLVSNTGHDPIGKSRAYFARGVALDYLADFEVNISGRGDQSTEVVIKALHPEVINGRRFGFGSCGPGFANRYVPVEATTIEEYEILLRIGQALGEKDMPPLILPP